MKPFVEKYAIFDNLPTLRLLDRKHIELFEHEAFGDNEMYHEKNTGMIQISGPRVMLPNRGLQKQDQKRKQSRTHNAAKRSRPKQK